MASKKLRKEGNERHPNCQAYKEEEDGSVSSNWPKDGRKDGALNPGSYLKYCINLLEYGQKTIPNK